MRPRFIQSWSHVSRTRSGGRQRQKEDGFSFRKPGRLSETSSSLAEKHARCIRWVASGGTRRRAKRRRSFSDLGINCKLVYRPQRTLGCWFIRRVVAAFASSSPSSLRSPFNSGSPVPSRPSNSRAWPTTKHPPFANGNCRKFHRILPRLASSIEPPLIRKSGAINVHSSSLSHRSSTRRERIRSLLQEKTF